MPPAPSPASGRKKVGTRTAPRARLHPRLSPPEPQLIPVPMSDGEDDDDQPPQGERQRQRSRSRERVHPHVQVPREPQIQPMVTPESDDEISDGDFTTVNPSSPSAGLPPSAEQRNRSRRFERSRSRERLHPRSSSHASQQQQPVVPPPVIQQNQAIQSEGENSATVGPENHVSDLSKSPQNPKGKKHTAEKQPSTLPKAKKYKPMDSDEDDEEPQNVPGTSQTTVPVQPLQQGLAASSQGRAASSQGPAASANSGDEGSEYSDEYSAQSQDSARTVPYPDLYVLTNDEHWAMTPETHDYAAAAGSFCLVTTENGRQQDIYNLTTMPCVQRSLYLNEMTDDFGHMQVEEPKGVDGRTRNVLEQGMTTCGKGTAIRAKRRSRARKEASAQEARGYYEQFAESKHQEYNSWVDNEVFDLVDLT